MSDGRFFAKRVTDQKRRESEYLLAKENAPPGAFLHNHAHSAEVYGDHFHDPSWPSHNHDGTMVHAYAGANIHLETVIH